MTYHTIRLEIAEGDHYDFEVRPFDKLSTRQFDAIQRPLPEDLSPLQQDQELIRRYSGAPDRFIRYLSMDEAKAALKHIEEVTSDLSGVKTNMDKVNETLAEWAKEHEGEEWTREDAEALLKDFGLFHDTIKVGDTTYTAPYVENAAMGQFIDLQNQMNVSASETESYVRALATMMVGPDGPYPVQCPDETEHVYHERCNAYTSARMELFWEAPWVQVMGVAAFFFSKSQRFAAITGHNMTLLNGWLSPRTSREPRVIPIDGEFMPK